eukprot:TRINITY_DN1806_c0_g1_i15.p1 TRINITY_DN1806_c0_g1~~TRINITY_DN1806_c0_g1_i15.p1  ORF type:complete len:336 (-),score=65.17 TRINITY_DN1806_c0_g1_i15:581-1588(-)
MESMSEYMENAYKLLYRWVKNECRGLDKDVPDFSVLLVEAFYALQDRPVLFSYCLQEVGDTRSKAVKRAFMVALTQGGPNGIPRPIEIHTHDPFRYVSDMSAWLHQSLASESELLHTLLRKNTRDTPTSKQRYDEQVSSILNKSLGEVSIPFKARVLQVLGMKPELVLTYRLANLLEFYRQSFLQLVGPGATITRVFEECRVDSMKVFHALAKKMIERLERALPIPPSDLSAPHEIYEAVNKFKEIMKIHTSSMAKPTTTLDDQKEDEEITAVLTQVFDPLLGVQLYFFDTTLLCLHTTLAPSSTNNSIHELPTNQPTNQTNQPTCNQPTSNSQP